MSRPSSAHRLATLLVSSAALLGSSCGTILHPERIGQPPGRIDPGIVALDGVGLLLFLIPGAIAFAIDFYTGAIYLPPHYAHRDTRSEAAADYLTAVRVDPQTLTAARVEQIVREQTGREIRLVPGTYSAVRLDSVEQFSAAAENLARHADALEANAVIFRGQSE